MQQVDQAIEKEAEERRKNLLKKEQKNINEEIKQVAVFLFNPLSHRLFLDHDIIFYFSL